MGELIGFPVERSKPSPDNERSRAGIDEKLAHKLAHSRFDKDSDRLALGTNWHAITVELKEKYGLRKQDIYSVVNNGQPNLDPKNAAKKTTYYECPPDLSESDKATRVGKIIKSGKKWLNLVEHAAKLAKKQPYFFLRRLLKDTSLLSPSVPAADIPEPIAAVLNLANAACRSIATQVELERFYEDWDRNRVSYQCVDDRFLPRSENSPLGDRFVFDGEVFYYYAISEPEGYEEEWPARPPLPSACFAKETLVVAEGCLVDRNSGTEHDVHVEFCREYRLAIGGSADTPIVEIRPELLVIGKDVNKREEFFPLHKRYVFSSINEKIREDGYSFMSLGSDKQESKCDAIYYNKILILKEIDQCGSDYLIRKEIGDKKFALSFGRHCALLADEYNYMDASYQELRVVLDERESTKRVRFPHYRLELMAEFDSVDVLNEPTSFAGILEYQLLQGTGEGTLYARLLEDARRKVNGFYECYNRVLEEIAERHRHALEQFGAPQKP
jgi:hypothetical protein